ncbi:MAG: hypothetical protein ABSA32_15345 [Candidatus Acidiferrales bacterium]|jgi:hypothetical protein
MFLGHNATWWALALAILTTFLSLPPGNLLAQALTVTFGRWIGERSKKSLVRTIAKMEEELAAVAKITPITETENHILWGTTSVRILLMGAVNIVIAFIYLGIGTVADEHTEQYKTLTGFVIVFFVVNACMMLRARYRHDYRYIHDPRRKAAVIKAIEKLKRIRDSWDAKRTP